MISLQGQKREAVARAAKDADDAIACLERLAVMLRVIRDELVRDQTAKRLSESPDDRSALVAGASHVSNLGRALPTAFRMVHGSVVSAVAMCAIRDCVANGAAPGDSEQVFDRPA